MLIDVDKLKDALSDYYGTAAFNGFPAAFADLIALDNLSGLELCELAEREGLDLEKYQAE